MTTRGKKAETESALALRRIGEYSRKIEGLLKNEIKQPILEAHALRELGVKRTYSRRVFLSLPIPPEIQALVIEEYQILKQVNELCRKGDISRPLLRILTARRFILNRYMLKWIEEEEKNPDVWVLTRNKKFEHVIGDNWMLLFVETLVLQLKKSNP